MRDLLAGLVDRVAGGVEIDADLPQPRCGALVLHLRRYIIGLRLLQFSEGRAAGPCQVAQPVAIALRQYQQHLGAIVVGVGGRKIGRVEDCERLAADNLLSKLHPKLRDAPRKRRQNLDEAGGVGFDDGRKHQIAFDLLLTDGIDRQLVTQRRSIGNFDSPAFFDEIRRANLWDRQSLAA